MKTSTKTISRLTALWAFAESGIGGLLHGLRLPVTGFVLGAFAIVCMGLIAVHSTHKFRDILQATLLVILVKAAASPHTPWPAYIAVGFQGIVGAVFFGWLAFFRLAALLAAVVALLESALQKFLFAYLVFGKAGFEALDLFFKDVAKFFGSDTNISFSWALIIGYSCIYVAWGIVVGWWLGGLPQRLQQKADSYKMELKPTPNAPAKSKKRNRIWLVGIATISFSILLIPVFYKGGSYLLIRTVAALVLFYFVVSPLIALGVKRYIQKRQAEKAGRIADLLEQTVSLRQMAIPAWAAAGLRHKGLKRIGTFVMILLVNFVYAAD